MATPDFVSYNQITPAGQRVLDHINAVLTEALEVAKTDVNALNALSGHYKDYYANVLSLRAVDNVTWLREHQYAASITLSLLEQQDEAARQQAAQEETAGKVNELAQNLQTLQDQLTEALAAIKARDEKITALESAQQPAAAPEAEAPAADEPKQAGKKTSRKEPEAGAEAAPQGELEAEQKPE